MWARLKNLWKLSERIEMRPDAVTGEPVAVVETVTEKAHAPQGQATIIDMQEQSVEKDFPAEKEDENDI